MKITLTFALVLLSAHAAFAHRLDEYLQATMFSLAPNRVEATMRLIPGVAVYPAVFAAIDTNHDGIISAGEQEAYAARVLNDLSLSMDGAPLKPVLESVQFPALNELKTGLGEIRIVLSAALPTSNAARELYFENRHLSGMSVYLVNSLVPADLHLRINAQLRNQNQSQYRLRFGQDAGSASSDLTSFPSMFRLGMRHIAEGTDHILFLLTLLLPAPLLAFHNHWGGSSGPRHSLTQILRVVTAFTIGHSITLALAACGIVHAPSRPVEVLIAVSILVSAIHALHPLFPGREAFIAGSFGLIHGLAFAATLNQLGLSLRDRMVNIFGFNLGIEAMQLIVVAIALPLLLLLSRTRAYPVFRIGGALFAGVASLGWIFERVFDQPISFNALANQLADHGIAVAGILLAVGLVASLLPSPPAAFLKHSS